ncbi:MAG: hypothetical protein HRT77_15740, partial [Halioglobus sp.]|nr:hypothetical protein [Halioglobus sp.]
PVITPFIIRMQTKAGIRIHLLKPEEDFSQYRKVIVPNGMWPAIKEQAERIPETKKVYCEVGFFPQNRNLYFDDKGVHGHSSIRDVSLPQLTTPQKESLDEFKRFYTKNNFIKVRWDTVNERRSSQSSHKGSYETPFIFVPLQLESDTAFDLCPFNTNQEMIDAIERTLPDKRVIFKVHPWDSQSSYTVRDKNLLLPYTNTDLRQLIMTCESVVNCNSTVMLESLLYGKKCASLGIGFATNHHISLECHDDIAVLESLDTWEPNQDRVDSFLFQLLSRQISIDFWKQKSELEKLNQWMSTYEIS